ncbi:hypothetical protein BJV78DRAFT_633711 [Lactifluus subvellereus]|nr:hypothetical protein BJV78DRAFT_633711 [Lactifluus subvellereus]
MVKLKLRRKFSGRRDHYLIPETSLSDIRGSDYDVSLSDGHFPSALCQLGPRLDALECQHSATDFKPRTTCKRHASKKVLIQHSRNCT